MRTRIRIPPQIRTLVGIRMRRRGLLNTVGTADSLGLRRLPTLNTVGTRAAGRSAMCVEYTDL